MSSARATLVTANSGSAIAAASKILCTLGFDVFMQTILGW
jgi:hypothetical protein